MAEQNLVCGLFESKSSPTGVKLVIEANLCPAGGDLAIRLAQSMMAAERNFAK